MKLKMLGLLAAVSLLLAAFPVLAAEGTGEIPQGTPTLDGVAEELWDTSSEEIPIEFVLQMPEGGSAATGSARLLWDDSYLYCLLVVNDGTPTTGPKDSDQPWGTDSVEVFLDEADSNGTDLDIAQFRVGRTDGKLSGMLQHTVKDEEGMRSEYADTKWGIKDGTDGYVVEIAIPWTRISPEAGATKIGLEFQINDEINDSGVADGIITSPCPDIWAPANYRTMTLVSEKTAEGQEAVEDTENGGEAGTSQNVDSNLSESGSGSFEKVVIVILAIILVVTVVESVLVCKTVFRKKADK